MSDPRPAAPGIQEYLDIPALSSSGMRLLLPPSCPAKFRYAQDHPTHLATFDLGKVAHAIMLGDSDARIVVVDAGNWRKQSAQDARDAAYAAGQTPILAPDYETAEAMAAAIREHDLAAALFDPDTGRPEQTLQWSDPATGVNMKCRLDWLPNPTGNRRLIVGDYKTAASADPDKFRRSAADFGYHVQAAHNLAGLAANGLDDDPAFVFVVQEKTPPYVVTVVELDVEFLTYGEAMRRAAVDVFLKCSASGRWPGYSDDVVLVSPPGWYTPPVAAAA